MTAGMAALAGELGDKPIHEVVRSIHAGEGTGTLEVAVGGQKRKLYFEDGNLVLAATHPLAKHLGELVGQLGSAPAEELRQRAAELVQRMASVVADWKSGSYRFDADPASLPAERVGPMPTERLVMLAAVSGLDEATLEKRLGGLQEQIAARPAFRKPDALGLAPEESFLLERLAQPMRVEAVLAESPVPRLDTLRTLVQLRVIGRVRMLGRDSSGGEAAPRLRTGSAAAVGDKELAARLHDRFAHRLRDEPLAMAKEEYRNRITEILGKAGGQNAYELLGVETSSSVEKIQAQYEKLALLVHPANERAYGLNGLQPMLEMLLDRATEAYVTLSDPERRRRYNETHAIELGIGGLAPISTEQREAEKREAGRKHYEQALALASNGDFHFAVELLELALKADRKVEYHLALARIQAKNPRWARRAIESCRAALDLDPQNTEVRFSLGQLYEAGGDFSRAKAQYAAAARENPPHPQAAAKLKELEAPAESRSGLNLFSRLFGKRE